MAAIPNPFYEPAWQSALGRAEGALAQCKLTAEMAAQQGFGGPRHLVALRALDAAREAVAAAWRSRFESIEAYARWRFSTLKRDQEDMLVQDFAAFFSIEDVDAAYLRAQTRVGEVLAGKAAFLNIGQPVGLAAFGPGEKILSSPRRFSAAELGRQGDEMLECVVSFHERGAEFHICIGHRWGALSAGAEDAFRLIATQLARQTIMILSPEAEILFAGGQHAAPAYRDLIRAVNDHARRFVFYRHLLPARGMKEQFCRVDMGWDGARFIDPDFSACLYEAVPASLVKI
ncbi:MAG: hypothetical protein POH28_02365 [Acidocella sp.]|nr:hypothetical protein [Acidocella sp.]